MIIHLPKNISHAYVQELADHVGALCLEKADHIVLITNHTDKHLGMTMVYDKQRCVGIITDGDVRRAILKYNDVQITATDIMTPSYKHTTKDALLSDALAIMDKHNITTLAVTETAETTEIIGIISIHHIIDFQS